MADVGQPPQFVRTIRVKNANQVGVLAQVVTILAEGGANLGDIRIVSASPLAIVRDVDIVLDSLDRLDPILESLHGLRETRVLEVRDEVLAAHAGGKIRVVPTVRVESAADLGRIYTPGVGEVALRIHEDPAAADRYTMIGNTAAIVTDGSAILGLGNLGPLAAMPVMEGKAALLAHLVGVNGVPVLVKSQEVAIIVATVEAISPTFGVIQLEDIASPRCFEVEAMLQSRLDRPVFHDDQHGTAAVVAASLLNACGVHELSLAQLRVGQVGLGAAGLAIARLLMALSDHPVLGADIADEALERLRAAGGQPASLDEVLATCDVVIATTGQPGLIPREKVRRGQIVFALSNPRPEIEPEEAIAAGARVAATGATINNLLCYPGLCRGLLDSKASRVLPPIFLAASRALVEATPEGQLLPSPLDRSVHQRVARAVARSAMELGVARRELDRDYFGETWAPAALPD